MNSEGETRKHQTLRLMVMGHEVPLYLRIHAFLITRSMAILPAVLIIGIRGDSSVTDLLTLSQVVLALQLPLAMFPLLHFTSSRKRMGKWRNGWFLLVTGWGSALLITCMDIYSLPDALKQAWAVIVGH